MKMTSKMKEKVKIMGMEKGYDAKSNIASTLKFGLTVFQQFGALYAFSTNKYVSYYNWTLSAVFDKYSHRK